MSNAHVWRAAQDRLRREMTEAQFNTWLRGTTLRAAADGSHLLCVRTENARRILAQAWLDRIESALASVTGQRQSVRILVSGLDGSSGDATEQTRGSTHNYKLHPPRPRPPHPESAGAEGYVMPSLFDTSSASADVNGEADGVKRPRASGGLWDDMDDADDGMSAMRSNAVRPPRTAPPASVDRVLPTRRSPGNGTHPPADLGRRLGRGTRDAASMTSETARREVDPHGAGRDDDAGRDGRDAHAGHDHYDTPRETPYARDGRDGMGSMSDDYSRDGSGAYRDYASPQADTGDDAGEGSQPPRLNPRYTFDTFIVGSKNQFAHAASLAVAEAPGQVYNPLFLYGGVGLGKTHLLHAIGHTAIEHGYTVLYVTSETFTNEIINAIRYRTTEQFRAKYRSVDVLLVDDVQFIAGKDSTEDEFFHTFNSLYEANKHIVMCSDRPPKAIVSLEERLRSRFEWGLAADIQPPDHEMRVAILRAKADQMGLYVPDEVMTFLAGREQSNIRELEGSFNRVLAVSDLQGMPLNLDTAKFALASLVDDRPRHVSINDVLTSVAEFYRIDARDICGKQRDKHIVVPRQVAMYLMRQETAASLLEIGQALGGRDHSTVLHGCDKISKEMGENDTLRKEVATIRQQLLG